MIEVLFFLAILLPSIILHEVSHGAVANTLGDPTAKNAGRLTLNPIPHIDPIGSVIVPFFLLLASGGRFAFGWAKPVPINPFNLRNQKYGSALVSFAGPGVNLAIALVFGLLYRFLPVTEINPLLAQFFLIIVVINVILAIFNLLPIPPLDGSHILFTFLPASARRYQYTLVQYGPFLLLGVILLDFVSGGAILGTFFRFVIGGIVGLITGSGTLSL